MPSGGSRPIGKSCGAENELRDPKVLDTTGCARNAIVTSCCLPVRTGRSARPHPRRLSLYECEQVGVDHVRVRCGHAVREILVGLQRCVLQKLGRHWP